MFGISFWLVIPALISYLVYTLSVVCPINDPRPLVLEQLGPKSPITYHTCVLSHQYFKPIYLESILPRYQQDVYPVLKNIDDQVGFTTKAHSTWSYLKGLDKEGKVSTIVEARINHAQEKIDSFNYWVETSVLPKTHRFKRVVALKAGYYWSLSSIYIEENLAVARWYYSTAVSKVTPYVDALVDKISSIEVICSIREWFAHLVEVFLSKTKSNYLQEKRAFIRSEFKNLVKFNEFYPRSKKYIAAEIQNLLGKDPVDAETEPTPSDDDYDSEGPYTITRTSTITATATDFGISVEQYADYNVQRLNQELEVWDNKVAKTLELASGNLETEMKPIIDQAIDSVKDDFSEQFQKLQSDNYKQYQKLNSIINEINKDFERIKQTNDTTIESYSRQDVRDVIAETYALPEQVAQSVQSELITTHEFVIAQYFKVIQDTIDILETFADTTIQEFSKSLSSLLEELSFENEEVVWQTWKQFHRVKEQIFEFRDKIMDNANEYKSNKDNNKELGAIGLEAWNVYLRKIEFHVNFLVRDNDDYLRLVRAKANVALQLREGLVRDLEAIKKAQGTVDESEDSVRDNSVIEETEDTANEEIIPDIEVELENEQLQSFEDSDTASFYEDAAETEGANEDGTEVEVDEEITETEGNGDDATETENIDEDATETEENDEDATEVEDIEVEDVKEFKNEDESITEVFKDEDETESITEDFTDFEIEELVEQEDKIEEPEEEGTIYEEPFEEQEIEEVEEEENDDAEDDQEEEEEESDSYEADAEDNFQGDPEARDAEVSDDSDEDEGESSSQY